MRCDEVIHELSAPAGRLDPSALAGHLEACTRCAEFAEQSERLDRLWDATRPADPSAAEVDRIWAKVSQALEAEAAPAVLPMRPARRAVAWLVPLAAVAAAVLLAVLPRLRGPEVAPPRGGAPHVAQADADPAAVELAEFDVEMGEITLIHMDGATVDERPMMTFSDTDTTPPTHAIFNYMEDRSFPQLDLLSALQ